MKKVLKMDYKGQTAVLSAFVLVGMVFLISAITEKALAKVTGEVYGTCGAPDSQPQIYNPCVFTIKGTELKGPDASNVNSYGSWIVVVAFDSS